MMRTSNKTFGGGIGRGFGVTAAAAVVAFSGLALPMAASAEPEPPVLRGPQVGEQGERQAQRGEEMRVEGRAQMAERARERLAVVAAMGAIRVLASDRAPEGLALSEEQSEAIRKIQAEHRAEVVAYYQEHKGEVRELLVKGGFDRAVELLDEERLRPEGIERVIGTVLPSPQGPMQRGEGVRDGAREGDRERLRERREERREQMERRAQAMRDMTPERREAIRGLMELRQGAPSPVAAARLSMRELNEGQRAWVTERVDAARQRAEEVRERQMREEETREGRQRRQGAGAGERQNRRRGGN
ncbi:MAG: hypothetical protein JJU33_02735 [Phycisphaerales bacterium]|nr:hypothetical protein [Phycisphaerales bacterium]